MEIKRVWKIFFSATGTTEKIVTTVADCLSASCGVEVRAYDFTLPSARETFPSLSETDLVVFGCPTYAGRLPNLLLKYLDTMAGNGAYAVPIVTFGNRAFDNSLAELCAQTGRKRLKRGRKLCAFRLWKDGKIGRFLSTCRRN